MSNKNKKEELTNSGLHIKLSKKQKVAKNPVVKVELDSLEILNIRNNLTRKRIVVQVKGFGSIVLLEGDKYPIDTPSNKEIIKLVKNNLGIK